MLIGLEGDGRSDMAEEEESQQALKIPGRPCAATIR